MAKTIAVSDDVYKKLKKAGMPGESFSSIIRRNLDRRPKLSELAGRRTLNKKDWLRAKRELARAERKTLEKLEAGAT